MKYLRATAKALWIEQGAAEPRPPSFPRRAGRVD